MSIMSKDDVLIQIKKNLKNIFLEADKLENWLQKNKQLGFLFPIWTERNVKTFRQMVRSFENIMYTGGFFWLLRFAWMRDIMGNIIKVPL